MASEALAGRRPLVAVWVMTWPLLITYLTQKVLTIVDTGLLGQFSTSALASVGLATPVYIVATMVGYGWATATGVFVAQHYGAGEHPKVGRITDVGLALSMVTGAVVGMLMSLVAPLLISVLSAEAELTGAAITYLRILALAVPFVAAIFTLQRAFSGVGATRVAMYTALVVNAVDIPLGIVMIFNLGWGVVGAGVSTVLGNVAGLGFMIWYGRHRLPTELELLRVKHVLVWRSLLARLWPVAWPQSTWLVVGYVNEVVLIGFVAALGIVELAAYRVLFSVTNLIIYVATACGIGVTILVGQRLGAGALDEAITYRRAGLRLAAMLTAVPALATLLWPRTLLGLLTDDPAVLALAVSTVALALLRLVAVVPMENLAGTLQAAGDTRTIMIASLVCDFLVLVPLAWLLALPLGLGLHGIFLAYIAWWLCTLGWLYTRYRHNTWHTTSVQETLDPEQTDVAG
jgi:putative MATE family efflux protein